MSMGGQPALIGGPSPLMGGGFGGAPVPPALGGGMGGRRMSMGGPSPLMGGGMPQAGGFGMPPGLGGGMRGRRMSMGGPSPLMGGGMPQAGGFGMPPGLGGGMRGRRMSVGGPPHMMGGGGPLGNRFNGGGMPADSRGHVFDPTRAARGASPSRGGGMPGPSGHPRQQSPSRGRVFDPTRAIRDASPDRGIQRRQSRGRMVDLPRRARSPSRGAPPAMPRSILKTPTPRFDSFSSSSELAHGGQRYDKVKNLKTGGMSVAIILLRGRRDGKYYVEKRVSVSDNFKARRAEAELDTLKKVRGQKHLNQLIEYSMLPGGQMSLILEYCDRQSVEAKIAETIRTGGGNFGESALWNIAMCVADGLAFLHNGIQDTAKSNRGPKDWDTMCHLDLKPCNIFISSTGGEFGESRIVLADFGCVVKYSDIMSGKEDYRRQGCGTLPWYPPEGIVAMQGGKGGYGTRTDVFMLGATIHAVGRLSPEVPIRPKLLSDSPCGSYYSADINTFVKKLVAHDFNERPSARRVAVAARSKLEGMVKISRRRLHFH
ncbi:Serine threonine- kinase H1 [Lecanosticta acicola]|uniref:Serine threonine- kinase H1 n=1 Tax=Lecanosticta acicola TaxID=111012 RepID=A0AAI8Z744_9PEZI|nr:Serine threonine- kinase H1 [Lecanosticta acicola]